MYTFALQSLSFLVQITLCSGSSCAVVNCLTFRSNNYFHYFIQEDLEKHSCESILLQSDCSWKNVDPLRAAILPGTAVTANYLAILLTTNCHDGVADVAC